MKRYFLYSIPLAFVWCFVQGSLTVPNFLFGMVLGSVVIRPFKPLYKFDEKISLTREFGKAPHLVKYFVMLIKEIIKANIMVAKIVLRPKIDIKPGIIAVPLRTKTDVGITAIANTITLTPGTLTIDISDDGTVAYVHAIDATNPQAVRDSIRDDLESYVLEAFE